jgi:CRP-like cAMP-binding protein
MAEGRNSSRLAAAELTVTRLPTPCRLAAGQAAQHLLTAIGSGAVVHSARLGQGPAAHALCMAQKGGVMSEPAAPNRLLKRLSKGEYKSLIGSERIVSLAQAEELYRQDGPDSMPHVYFPTSGVISLTVLMEDGTEVETATIGNEGMIGLPVALGLDSSPIRAVSQVSGEGLRISTPAFLKALKPNGTLDVLVRRYTAFSMRYANQTVACNLLHSLEERMCRWLLMTHDRVEEDEFLMTHEYLAEMLGVRRQTVSVVAGALQTTGLLTYRRGVIRVLNREGLEAASCECYRVSTTFYDRIMRSPSTFN